MILKTVPTPVFTGDEIVQSGEVVGRNGSSCVLGSLDLKKFLVKENGVYALDFAALSLAASIAVKFLDNVVDLTKSGISLFDDVNVQERKIGLGAMGWADVLAFMGLPYDSEEARQYAEETAKVLYISARKASQILAKERGTYPGYNECSIDPITLQAMYPQRNSNLLALAPTGTLSLVSEVNASIEPFFMLAYKKNFKYGGNSVERSSIITSVSFKEIIMEHFEEDTAWRILEDTANTGTLNTNPEFSDEINSRICELQPALKTAYEISPEAHVLMQAAWQKYIDLSCSKTINMPNSATVEDILGVIYLAWKVGSKGITIYRDASRSEQILEKPKN
jgi:ribonucleoside-diphosphate reductase alpha chain